MSFNSLQFSLQISQDTSEPTLKSTLPYNKTPSPPLLNTNINFSMFRSIDVTEKAKKKLGSNYLISKETGNVPKSRRNQSMGSIPIKDVINPQTARFNSTMKKQTDTQFIELNKQTNKQIKAKNFMNKLFGTVKPGNSINQHPNQSHKLDMTLPVINHKKSYARKSNFLQHWLDQALDPQQLSTNQNDLLSSHTQLNPQGQQQKSSYLSTVKKYHIDRTYLKSQNIPHEIIERLYNTLFIYTHGINTVFSELLGFVKSAPGQQTRDSSILSNFWKCFVKLLEGCTSFQTSFQKVEEQYLARVNHLKEMMIRKESEFMKQREKFDQKMIKFEKERVEMMNNYNKLESEHRIATSTLQLTDNAFNEEVQLRLKFEQKINHIYSSYEQLREKYKTIMSTLQIKNQESYQKASLQQKLKQRIRQLQSSVQQLKDLLAKQKQKVHFRELQVSIKKQELLDMEMSLQLKQQKEQEGEDVMETEINKNALLKTKVEELENRKKLLEFTNEGLTKKLQEEKRMIEAYRKMNEELHQKYNEASQKLVEYEAHKIFQSAEITKLTTQLLIIKQQLSLITQQKSSLQSKLSLTLQQLHQSQFQVQTKASAMQGINATIQDLKAIKNKYEILWKIMEKEKSDLQKERNSIHQKYELEKEEFIGLKMLHENRQKYIKDIEAKHEKEKELLKRKITGYNEIVTKKESIILAFQKSEQEKSDLLLKRNYRIEQMEKELTDQKAVIERKTKDNEFLVKRLDELEKEIKSIENKLKSRGKQLQKKLTEFDITSQELSSVKSLLSLIKQEQNSSITNFTTLFQDYRQLVMRKGQHIHPMLYEDLTHQFNRAKLEIIPRLEGNIIELQEEKERMEKQIERLEHVIIERDREIIQLNDSLVKEKHTTQKNAHHISQIKQQIITLQRAIKQKSSQLNNHQNTISQKQLKITELTAHLQTVNQKLSQATSSLSAKQIDIEGLTANVNILSERIASYEAEMQQKQKNNPYLIKIEKLEKQLGETKKELSGYKNIVKDDIETQTDQPEPEGEVAIFEPKQQSASLRKNKFFMNQSTPKTDTKQVQVSLPPYNSIPQYIDTKIQQIKRQGLQQENNDSKVSFVMKSKSKESPQLIPLSNKQSLSKLDSNINKESITKRQELRRALRFTYMRR